MTPTHQQGHRMPAAKSHKMLPYLQAWRLHRVMTVRGLAEQAGVGVSTVVRGEAGDPVSALSATKLARALGITTKQLQEEEPTS